MKVVLDTNVLLAAFATRGLCEAVMMVCLNDHEIILSEPVLDEVRKHLAGKFKMPASRTREIEAFLRQHARVVIPSEVLPVACRDPDDCAILGTAEAGQAGVIITGDKDLLVLERFRGIQILSPRAFHDQLC